METATITVDLVQSLLTEAFDFCTPARRALEDAQAACHRVQGVFEATQQKIEESNRQALSLRKAIGEAAAAGEDIGALAHANAENSANLTTYSNLLEDLAGVKPSLAKALAKAEESFKAAVNTAFGEARKKVQDVFDEQIIEIARQADSWDQGLRAFFESDPQLAPCFRPLLNWRNTRPQFDEAGQPMAGWR